MGKIVTVYLSDDEVKDLKIFCDENRCTQYSALKTAVKELISKPIEKPEDKQEVPIEKKVMDRNSAEKKHGFRLYQGGVPPGNCIRVLNIPNIDVEACGGTHLNNTSEVEKIRIIKTERIQDGVNRIVFAAGKMADVHHKEEMEIYSRFANVISSVYEIKERKNVSEQLKEVSKIFSVPIEQLNKTLKRFLKEAQIKDKKIVKDLKEACENLFSEWKKTRKMIKQSFSLKADLYKEELIKTKEKEIKIIFEALPRDKNPIKYAQEKTEQEGIIAYIISGNRVTLSASKDVNINLGPIAQKVGRISGGSGGGKSNLAHATIKDPDKNYEAMEKTKELIKKKLEKN